MNSATLLDQMEKDNSFYGSNKSNQLELLKNVIRDCQGCEVYKTELHVDHDGYDSFGPVSDIIDLVIWVKTPTKQHEIWSYHTEEWFTSNSPPPFILDTVSKVSEELWTSSIKSH